MNKRDLEALLTACRDSLDAISGAAPVLLPRNRLLLGILWLVLAALAYAFGGHGTKFIYVDF